MPAFTTLKVRPQVEAFALAMERKLRENDHKGGWRGMNNGSIMARIQQELAELTAALASKRPLAVRDEAADVANFLMMLCQNNKALDFANDEPCKPRPDNQGERGPPGDAFEEEQDRQIARAFGKKAEREALKTLASEGPFSPQGGAP